MRTQGRLKIDFEVNLLLNESEVKALDALAGYGTKEFLKVFYEKLGKAYLEPHEKALWTLFDKIKELSASIAAIDQLRKDGEVVRKKFDV